MKKSNLALAATVSTLIAVGGSLVASPAMAASKEKCYGIVAAGQNDCATKSSSCAGTSKVDNQGDAFIAVPKGLCAKITGGSLTPKED
ncbi:hypothetical protein CW745_03845 [Psychromonas sp. psych-6C06]|uniref:BufA1 family periplasmic bufferin-type metallophore n=1 Tax=Psychromonas sp. psych-6C06 TaxID=2058089 RepID=UPI000C331AE9|nr:DUF2282 domain-containing protein [Psychromonas sp. psych-6C06]PKF62564.1 hypothetical protein CW745_03845 [Psychromonas sp. psych-6C06]